MLLSYNWLKKYVDLPEDLSMDQLAYDLTMRTVEVESVRDLAKDYEKIVAGKILKVEAHPNADKLRLVTVDVGAEEPSMIVCGGSNLYEDHYVLVNLPGSKARWHGEGEAVIIEPAVLRGVKSYGMISGSAEVGLEDFFPAGSEREIVDFTAEGVEEEKEIYPGQPVADLLDFDDTVIEIENKSLTHRPDLWGHYGIARELAAIYGRKLKPLPEYKPLDLPEYPMEIEDPDLCHRLLLCKIEGVDERPSPIWMRSALVKCGMRPINALVDITNYVNLASGNPCHAYDANHIHGTFYARPSRKGEQLTILDGHQLDLKEGSIVMADDEKILGLAGLMGGRFDSIGESTDTIVYEIASLDGARIREDSQDYDVRTEASVRFEKGLDSQRVGVNFVMASHLIQEIFPGSKAVAFSDKAPQPTQEETVNMSLSWLSRRLGQEVDREDVDQVLTPLGFDLGGEGDELIVHAPSWRSTGDISLPDDILEEVARMLGYENFDILYPEVTLTKAINQRDQSVDRQLREYLARSCGFYEIYTYSWVKDEFVEACGLDRSKDLELAAPPAPDQAKLRTSLVPGLVEAAVKNLRFYDEFSLFESGEVYEKGEYSPSIPEEVLPVQTRLLAGVVVDKDPAEAFYRVKGVLEHIQDWVQVKPIHFSQEDQPVWADQKAWLNICNGEEVIGSMGLLSNKAKHEADINYADLAIFSLEWEKLEVLESRSSSFTPLPQYPHVQDDLSITISDQYSWADIRDKISPLVAGIQFVDEYRGDQVPEGHRSLTFRVDLASDEGTLTRSQVEGIRQRLLGILEAEFSAKFRDK